MDRERESVSVLDGGERGTYLQHEGMRRVHEYGGVLPGRGLQAQLGVCGLGVVGEGDAAGQLPVVQHLLMVLRQVDVTLRFKLECALCAGQQTQVWRERWGKISMNCILTIVHVV